MYDRILLATDGSDRANEAAVHAVDVAAHYDATLHGLYVIETRTAYDNAIVNPQDVRDNLRTIGETALADVTDLAARAEITFETSIQEGIPAETILEYVGAHDIDALFLGERGNSTFKTVLLGSTSESVLHETDIPVTIV